MKRFITPVLLTAALLFSASGFTQTVKLDDHFSIQLTSQTLEQKSVQFDITGLNFKDEADAQKFFNSIQNNLVNFSVDYATKTATMFLYPERLGKTIWTIEDWNQYLDATSQRCTTTYQSFSNF